MKTRITGMLLIVLFTLSLMGCSFGKSKQTANSSNDAAFEYNGVTVSIRDENMDNVFAAFGEPESKEGDNPGFYYTFDSGKVGVSSYIINQIDDEKRQEFPDMISIKDENIKTSKGISVGSTEEEVKAAYGETTGVAIDSMNILTYSYDDYIISFIIDQTVSEIKYTG